MARIRTVKPEFFRHEILQDLEITHPGKCPMLVFAGLWGHCDKAGRFQWRPRLLKLDILPFMPFDMAETLGILEAAGLLKKYTVNECEYGLIPSFVEHQRIGGKEAQEPEKHPAPDSEVIGKQRGSNWEATGKQSGLQEGKGREGNKTPPPDGGSTVWDFGKSLLAEQGISTKNAGALIGSWLREWSEAEVAEALRSAAGKADVRSYVSAILKTKPKKGVEPERRVAL